MLTFSYNSYVPINHIFTKLHLIFIMLLILAIPTNKTPIRNQNNAAITYYNLINNFSIIACDARRARSCATAYILTGAQHTLRAGIVRDDRELFHQIIAAVLFIAYNHHLRRYPSYHSKIKFLQGCNSKNFHKSKFQKLP